MKLFKLSVLLLALGLGGCESGFPTEPDGSVVVCDPHVQDDCGDPFGPNLGVDPGDEKGDKDE